MVSYIRGNDNFDSADTYGTMDCTTLANVAGSRSNNTWYQNTTGKPMIVSIQTTGWNGRVYVGSSTSSYTEVSKNSANGSGQYEQDNHTFVVPNSWYYYYVGGNRNQWTEYT
jgi:hypothetical protein